MSLTLPNTTIDFSYPELNESWMEQFMSNVFDGLTAGTATAGKAVLTDSNNNVLGFGVRSTMIAAGSTKTLAAANNDNFVQLNQTGGSVVTLPAATGSGVQFTFYVSVLATSNSHIVYCNGANGGGGSDVFIGLIQGTRIDSGNAPLSFAASSNSNTITMNRTTTGSVTVGEYITVTDVATNKWLITSSQLSATGAAFATPFSHT